MDLLIPRNLIAFIEWRHMAIPVDHFKMKSPFKL